MKQLKILDVTLRDGGYVNNFEFGKSILNSILSDLISSKVDACELGFLKDCEYHIGRTWFTRVAQAEQLLSSNISDVSQQEYFLMIRPDWYDISQLEPCLGRIKNLRFAFHFRDIDLLKFQVKRAKDLGYNIYLNPVNITSYTQHQLEELLLSISSLNPSAVAIVDTFGSLMNSKLRSIVKTFDDHLDPSVSLCFHPHDNLLLSFSLSQLFIELLGAKRDIWVDSSLNGMGRAPGNLQTELILNYLNIKNQSDYIIPSVLNGVKTVIDNFKKPFAWGYHPLYALSAFYEIHRSYPEYLLHSSELSPKSMHMILEQLKDDSIKERYDVHHISNLISQLN